jgi:hypothetical protein
MVNKVIISKSLTKYPKQNNIMTQNATKKNNQNASAVGALSSSSLLDE